MLGAMEHLKELTETLMFTRVANMSALLTLYLSGNEALYVICLAR